MSRTSRARPRAPFRSILALVLGAVLAAGIALPAFAESPEFGPSTQQGTIGSDKSAGTLRECPANKVLVGVRVEDRTNAAPSGAFGIIADLDILCGTIRVDSPSTITVVNDAAFTDYAAYDNRDGAPDAAICPANTVVTRMGGHFFQGQGFPWASDIQISCQPLLFDAQGRMRTNIAATPTVLQAGDNENLNAPAGLAGPFCGTTNTQIVRGYRPQAGGEGYDGINVSCASFASDFGDAPASYPDAGFEINGATFLGASVDSEGAEQPSANAGADGADDDGVVFPTIIGGFTPTATVPVTATNHAPVAAVLTGWIDFDGNGVFETSERVTTSIAPGFSGPVNLVFPNVAAQTAAAGGATFARFTIATNGVAGEVEDHRLVITAQAPALAIAKSSTTAAVTTVGQRIPYTFAVSNTGNVTMSNVAVTDPRLGAAPVCAETVIAPGESTQCAGVHTVTQADLDAGRVVNTATVTGTPPGSTTRIPPVTSNQVIIPARQSPAMTVVKSSSTSVATAAGQQIPYAFTVTNTGNVTLSGVTIADANLDAAAVCAATVLAPTASTRCTGVHTVTQAELDAGDDIVNTATATGTPPGSTAPIPPVTSNEVVIPTRPAPALSIVKSSSTTTATVSGQQIPYTFTVTNTGNVTVSGVAITDPNLDAAATCGAIVLAPSASTACTGVHTVTQDEIDAGDDIVNTATVTGTPPGSSTPIPPVTSNEVVIPVQQTPALTIAKSSSTTSATASGQQIPYLLTVTNTGNVTLADIEVADAPLDAPATCDATELNPGEATQCTGVHTVTQAELDAGDDIVNTATVTGTPPGSTTPIPPTPSNPVTIPVVPSPALTIEKSSTTTSVTEVGQAIPYTFIVTNTGSVTISNVVIDDAQLDEPAACDADELAPGETTECTGSHAVTQAELDAGGDIVNTATVTGTPPGSSDPIPPVPSNPVVIPTEQTPALTLEKTASDDAVRAGATIAYTFVVTNTGNVTISDVVVSDRLPGLSALECDTAEPVALAAGEALTCTAAYIATAADAAAGVVRNSATVTGTDPSGDPVTAGDTVDVSIAVPPAGGSGQLPGTGGEFPLALLAIALLLMVAGGVIAARRRAIR